MKKYFFYWGKSNNQDKYHPLVYHSLDAAAVGKRLFYSLGLHERCTGKFSAELMEPLLIFAISLHDIGKFSTSFQNLNPGLMLCLQNKTSNYKYDYKNGRHDSLGWILYKTRIEPIILKKLNSTDEYFTTLFLDVFFQITFGHHGIPPQEGNRLIKKDFAEDDVQAAETFCYDSFDLFFERDQINHLNSIGSLQKAERKEILSYLKSVSWELAGFVSICDWISSGEFCPFVTNEMPLKEYFDITIQNVEDVITRTGILPKKPNNNIGFNELFHGFSISPTPLQELCDSIFVKNCPSLFILEDITGSGKTEASLTIVSKIIGAKKADGCFIALPTMATSNAMYERMGSVYKRFYDETEKPSLILSHGTRYISNTFLKSFSSTIISDNVQVNKYNEADLGAFYCTKWLADSTKKSLLADIGVGTIDQVLISVLPVRYQSMRFFGMSRKILIIDEVHSYDPYMLKLLSRVLEAVAASGGSVILLSATLPLRIKRNLVHAFEMGMGERNDTNLISEDFPLMTICTGGEEIKEISVKPRIGSRRTVHINFIADFTNILKFIEETLKSKKCLCWIRNTVADVLEAYNLITERLNIPDENIIVFHSRFTLYDRTEIEKKVLSCFGPESDHEHRKRKILIASQVVEQSLDLDFDEMISDLAPIDLLIQRMGRLHRHYRDKFGNRLKIEESKKSKYLFNLFAPPDTDNPEATWYSDTFPHATFVYPDTATLWRTYKILKDTKKITVPDDSREYIEAVYGDDPIDIPECFYDSELEQEGDSSSKTSMALFNLIKLRSGYSRSSSDRWDEEENVPTRLIDEQIDIFLCCIKDDVLLPLFFEKNGWELSSLSINGKVLKDLETRIFPKVYNEKLKEAIDVLKRERFLKKDTLFLITENKNQMSWKIDTGKSEKIIKYDKKIGLFVE